MANHAMQNTANPASAPYPYYPSNIWAQFALPVCVFGGFTSPSNTTVVQEGEKKGEYLEQEVVVDAVSPAAVSAALGSVVGVAAEGGPPPPESGVAIRCILMRKIKLFYFLVPSLYPSRIFARPLGRSFALSSFLPGKDQRSGCTIRRSLCIAKPKMKVKKLNLHHSTKLGWKLTVELKEQEVLVVLHKQVQLCRVEKDMEVVVKEEVIQREEDMLLLLD